MGIEGHAGPIEPVTMPGGGIGGDARNTDPGIEGGV